MKKVHYLGLILVVISTVTNAAAGTKEEIMRLQSDVLAMQNQIRLLEKTFKEQTEGIRSLVVQLNDQLGKTGQILARVSATLDNQASGDKSAGAALLQEIRNLSAKVDDSATRISALAMQIADMKVQSKPLNQRLYQSAGGEAGAGALSPDAIYSEAYNDLIQGNFDLSIEGFTAFIKNYPNNDRADDAQYNIGEAYYNSNKLPQAIAAFSRVANDFPTGDKVASAYFKRAKAELLLQEKENAIADFKSVIDRFPESPEASLSKTELESLGVSLAKPAAKPSPAKRKPR